MTLQQALAAVALLVFLALGIYGLPRVWRNETGLYTDEPAPWWPLGTPTWRAVVRQYLLSVAWVAITLPLFVALLLFAGDEEIVMALLGAPFFASWGLMGSIALFNVPKLLVPPHLRHQPGLLAEWRGVKPTPTPPPRLYRR